ncbi:hypothetical protein AB0N05_26525 [Nocardia sp. NPDC051030]|uniref:hypothetical protein n=1 Tax=Nocardia sp. NPDC051030 TaxID=3155162 RepID=UPI0034196940
MVTTAPAGEVVTTVVVAGADVVPQKVAPHVSVPPGVVGFVVVVGGTPQLSLQWSCPPGISGFPQASVLQLSVPPGTVTSGEG